MKIIDEKKQKTKAKQKQTKKKKFWLLENIQSRFFSNTLSIKNGGYAFLIRLDLMFSKSLWKEFQLLPILNDPSIKHLIKLIFYENDINLLDFKRNSV